MPANTNPIFPLTPQIGAATLTTANTATDGTGTVSTLITATVDGTRVDYIKARALGTNVTTVLRVFLNNGGVNTTATNNMLWAEQTLPATTASNSVDIGPDIVIPINLSLPNGWKINVVIGTAVSAGWRVTAVGGNY